MLPGGPKKPKQLNGNSHSTAFVFLEHPVSEENGYNVFLFCFEVSVRGQLMKANRARLKSFLYRVMPAGRSNFMKLVASFSKAALLGSFSIFCARDEEHWSIGGDISVNL